MKTILVLMILVLGACASPMPKKEVDAITFDCSNVERQIWALKREETDNSRVLSGARSIIPIGMVVGILRWDYFDHLSIATGSWDRSAQMKMNDMESFKKECVSTASVNQAPLLKLPLSKE